MKKIFALSAMLALHTINSFAQTIPNGGFENWTNMGTYDNIDMWGTMNNTTAMAGIFTANKSTPGTAGNYCLKLTSKTIGSTVINGIAVSGIIDSTTMLPKSGFACTSRPANLIGKWQHMIYGGSQGSISITLTRWDAGSSTRIPVGSGSLTLSGMAMSWSSFSIPINYLDGANPDTCIIVLKASGSMPSNNDYLWIDELAFSGSVPGTGIINNTNIIEQMEVFPNPTSEKINIRLKAQSAKEVRIELLDINGKTIRICNVKDSQNEVLCTLPTSDIAKGNYFIKAIVDNESRIEKIAIQ